jgi:DNA-binding transcriptional ArsR family regulator
MPPITVLVALADPTRCRIIEILQRGPQPVHTLAGAFDISRPAISRHLRVLKQAKLISEKKAGRENRYALHANRLKPVRDWLDRVQASPAKLEGKVASAKAAKPVAAKPAPVAAKPATPAVAPPSAPPKAASQMGFDF